MPPRHERIIIKQTKFLEINLLKTDKINFAIPFPFPIFVLGLAMNQAVHI